VAVPQQHKPIILELDAPLLRQQPADGLAPASCDI
jgi:hypothetical protein